MNRTELIQSRWKEVSDYTVLQSVIKEECKKYSHTPHIFWLQYDNVNHPVTNFVWQMVDQNHDLYKLLQQSQPHFGGLIDQFDPQKHYMIYLFLNYEEKFGQLVKLNYNS